MNTSVGNKIIAGFASLALMLSISTVAATTAQASSNKNSTSISKTKDGFPSLKGKVKNMKGVWVDIEPVEDNSNVVQDFVVKVRKGIKLPIKVRLDSSEQGNVPVQEWIVTKPNQIISVEGPEGYCTRVFFKIADKKGKTGLQHYATRFYNR